jgi:hypothetical protein
MCEDYVRLGGDQLFREWLILICAGGRKANFDLNVAALGPSALFKSLPKGGKPHLRFRIVLGVTYQHPYPSHSVGLLCTRHKWPRRRRAAQQSDELAPLHSITSSARASSCGGTVRPSIRAVAWLITSSNLTDCTTGKSAALAPLRMRPV